MTRRKPESEALRAVPEQVERQSSASRKPARDKYEVYRLADDDDLAGETEYLFSLPLGSDVEQRIRRECGAGSYRIEHRRGGRYVSVREFHLDDAPSRRIPSDDAGDDELLTQEQMRELIEEASERAAARALESERVQRVARRRLREQGARASAQASDPVEDAMRLLARMRELNNQLNPTPETPAKTATEPKLSDEDRALIMLIKDRDMRSRITSNLFAATEQRGGDKSSESWLRILFQELAERPKLSERILNRLLPEPKARDDEGEGEGEDEDLEESCVTYLLEKCAADEVITLNDEPVRALAVANPQAFKDFLSLINLASVEQVIEHLSEEFDLARVVLRAPHARAWLAQLKELATAVTS